MSHIRWICTAIVLGSALSDVEAKKQDHPDYVPDAQTAEAIGRVVLSAKFGVAEVDKQSPLTAAQGNDGVWIVQGNASQPVATGGGMAVWIDRHSGCIVNIFAYMK